MPLSEHIYSSESTGRQELSLSHYFKLHLRKLLGWKLECLGEKLGLVHFAIRIHAGHKLTSRQNDHHCDLHFPCGLDWYQQLQSILRFQVLLLDSASKRITLRHQLAEQLSN